MCNVPGPNVTAVSPIPVGGAPSPDQALVLDMRICDHVTWSSDRLISNRSMP